MLAVSDRAGLVERNLLNIDAAHSAFTFRLVRAAEMLVMIRSNSVRLFMDLP
jgi:hypothetical protein